jgi:hypothetical protein
VRINCVSNLPHNLAFSPLVSSLPTEIYFFMRCTSLTLSNNFVAPMCNSCDIPTVNNANSSMSTTQASKPGKDDAIQLNLVSHQQTSVSGHQIKICALKWRSISAQFLSLFRNTPTPTQRTIVCRPITPIMYISVSQTFLLKGPFCLWKYITADSHIFAHGNIGYPDYRYPKLNIYMSELILDRYLYIPVAYVTLHLMIWR